MKRTLNTTLLTSAVIQTRRRQPPNRDSHDVPLHAGVEVCLYPGDPSSSPPRFQEQLAKTHDWAPLIRLRRPLFNLLAPLHVKTSTRIPVLSP